MELTLYTYDLLLSDLTRQVRESAARGIRQVTFFFEGLPVTGKTQEDTSANLCLFEVLKIFVSEEPRSLFLDPRKQLLVVHFSYLLDYGFICNGLFLVGGRTWPGILFLDGVHGNL